MITNRIKYRHQRQMSLELYYPHVEQGSSSGVFSSHSLHHDDPSLITYYHPSIACYSNVVPLPKFDKSHHVTS